MNNNMTTVNISDMKIVNSPNVLITYSLGSCVGICLYDSIKKIAGMAHILLPKINVQGDTNILKYADSNIPHMVKEMEKMGCSRIRMTAKIAGGAEMFKTEGNTSSFGKIGQRNVQAVKETLQKINIKIVAEDVGKDYGRTMVFNALNGEVTIKSFNHETKVF